MAVSRNVLSATPQIVPDSFLRRQVTWCNQVVGTSVNGHMLLADCIKVFTLPCQLSRTALMLSEYVRMHGAQSQVCTRCDTSSQCCVYGMRQTAPVW